MGRKSAASRARQRQAPEADTLPTEYTPLLLDWRTSPSRPDVLERIHRLLLNVDSNGSANMFLFSSQSLAYPGGAQLMFVDEELQAHDENDADNSRRRMYVYRPKHTQRLVPAVVTGRHRDGCSGRYLLLLFVIAESVAKTIDRGEPQMRRQYIYHISNATIPRPTATRLLHDLALTTGVHPYVLGMIPQPGGRFLVPNGYRIEMEVCGNLFKWMDRRLGSQGNGCVTQSYSGIDSVVPSLIQKLKIVPTGDYDDSCEARAVIVVEHRNIKDMLGSLIRSGDALFKGLFFVLTGGFTDLATREFLHLLSADPELSRVPFLFVSDHDPHAMTIFANLKYGSRNASYASHILTCPRLKWAGVSIATFTKLAHDWPDKVAQMNADRSNHSQTDAEVKRARQQVEKGLLGSLKLKSARLNNADRNRIIHIHRHKLFSEVYDPELYQELQLMGMNPLEEATAIRVGAPGMKFALGKVAQYNDAGIQDCFLAILVENGIADLATLELQLNKVSDIQRAFEADGSTTFQADIYVPEDAPQSEVEDENGSQLALRVKGKGRADRKRAVAEEMGSEDELASDQLPAPPSNEVSSDMLEDAVYRWN